MKKTIYRALLLPLGLFALASCTDFLEKQPLSNVSPETFFTESTHLEAYCNNMHTMFPDHSGTNGTLGRFTADQNSDNMVGQSQNDNFLLRRVTVPSSGSYSSFSTIRTINLFLQRTAENLENGTLADNTVNQHYIGEMYFFRAYVYYSFLTTYGDMPIITEVLDDKTYDELTEANKRQPRNVVARFILDDLDQAIERLQNKGSEPTANRRVNKQVAQLFKSRVALFEGTWEKYHAGTARVPDRNAGWPGAAMDYNADFSYDNAAEVQFFLQTAMDAAKAVADFRPLNESDKYVDLYNKMSIGELDAMSDVLLARLYSEDAQYMNPVIGATHGVDTSYPYPEGYGAVGGGNTGYTRSLVNTFLMKSGLPIYADSDYRGDATIADALTDRDERISNSIAKEGDYIYAGDYFYIPWMVKSGSIAPTTTGYAPHLGYVQDDAIDYNLPSSLQLPLFRVAEAYLNYIEADYVIDGNLSSTGEEYWKSLRRRAGVSDDINATVAATDLSLEEDLGKYSGETMVDPMLYNIRRERRCELFATDGLRLDDLYRWRSLDMMENTCFYGINYWDHYASLFDPIYGNETSSAADVLGLSPATDGKYLRMFHNNNLAQNGYTFDPANYLSPLSYDVFRLACETEGDVSTTVVYQNPDWPVTAGEYSLNSGN
ncbi:MAG: RagB/SusD family nutrient uptake outer membrane protein [Bacteroidetes bacterium]|uniref:RagB/SusD family nutrient uptake outer membrane protein n=1 Tax=Candidatus Cryptobacteroides excrementipullorum TaxID=2840761 RepID=A0A9D9IS92_9BACT|nr:RagB/SusD family nutrient uptake outer membrane protein [Candidatus Cryptobacteroides excrementipullorum]